LLIEKSIIGHASIVSSPIAWRRLSSKPDSPRSEDITFAIELEPGPLYALNDMDALLYFRDSLVNKGLQSVAVLNLDIAHWELAKLWPKLQTDHEDKLINREILKTSSMPTFQITLRDISATSP